MDGRSLRPLLKCQALRRLDHNHLLLWYHIAADSASSPQRIPSIHSSRQKMMNRGQRKSLCVLCEDEDDELHGELHMQCECARAGTLTTTTTTTTTTGLRVDDNNNNLTQTKVFPHQRAAL